VPHLRTKDVGVSPNTKKHRHVPLAANSKGKEEEGPRRRGQSCLRAPLGVDDDRLQAATIVPYRDIGTRSKLQERIVEERRAYRDVGMRSYSKD
jgi:hypothetical protein